MSDSPICIVAQPSSYTEIDGTVRCRWVSTLEIADVLDAGSVLPGTAVKIFGQKSDIGKILELPPGRVLCGHLSRPRSIGSHGTWVDYEVTTEHKTTIILALPLSVVGMGYAMKFLLYLKHIWYIIRRGTHPTPHHNLALMATGKQQERRSI